MCSIEGLQTELTKSGHHSSDEEYDILPSRLMSLKCKLA